MSKKNIAVSKKNVSVFNRTVVDTRVMGKTKEITYIINKEGVGKDRDIEVEDVKKIYNDIENGLGDNAKFMIRCLNPKQWFTLKGYSDHELELDDYEDYFRNKVKDMSKFGKFFQIELTISVTK
jgi:hypothetical protein